MKFKPVRLVKKGERNDEMEQRFNFKAFLGRTIFKSCGPKMSQSTNEEFSDYRISTSRSFWTTRVSWRKFLFVQHFQGIAAYWSLWGFCTKFMGSSSSKYQKTLSLIFKMYFFSTGMIQLIWMNMLKNPNSLRKLTMKKLSKMNPMLKIWKNLRILSWLFSLK